MELSERRTTCGLVTDYDDSIGGEGEVLCGWPMLILAEDRAKCEKGHKWLSCDCGRPTCEGWRFDRG